MGVFKKIYGLLSFTYTALSSTESSAFIRSQLCLSNHGQCQQAGEGISELTPAFSQFLNFLTFQREKFMQLTWTRLVTESPKSPAGSPADS